MPDGTLGFPQGANFLNEPGLGMWRPAANLMGFAVNNGAPFLSFQVGTGTQLNSDPINPSIVRYAARGFIPALVGGTNETAHFFCRVDPTVGNPQQAGLYLDITAAQLDTQGPGLKVIHAGSGDAVYVAQVAGNGSAYEAATWSDGTRGFISTIQVAGLANSTLFNALWAQDTVPNFGMFFADGATANAFTIRRRDSSGVAGLTQIRLIEQLGRQRFGLYNDGAIALSGELATVGTPLQASPEIRLFGSVFSGGVAHDTSWIAKVIPDSLDGSTLAFFHVSDVGTELDLQLVSDGAGGDPIMVLGPTGGGQYRGADLQSPIRLNLLYGGGNLGISLDDPVNNDETAIALLTIRQGGVLVTKLVTQGAVDSGGAGFRVLRVPN